MKLFKVLLLTGVLFVATTAPSYAISELNRKHAAWILDVSARWFKGTDAEKRKVESARKELIKNCFTSGSNDRDCKAAIDNLTKSMR